MRRIKVDGRSLACEERGSGDPVMLLHTGFVADSMRPLAADDRLAAGRRLILYHRRGYGESDPAAGPLTLADEVADALALMDALNVDAAHLVGHSLGATIALELALTTQARVRSLVAMEPLLLFALTPESARVVGEAAAVALPRFQAGDHAGALDAWLTGAFGPGYRETLEAALPGAFEQAVRDAGTSFGVEVPAVQAWPRGPDDLRRVEARTLSVVNAGTSWPGFRETHDALLRWLPHAEGVVVPARSHLLHIEDPGPVVEAVVNFLDGRGARERAGTGEARGEGSRV